MRGQRGRGVKTDAIRFQKRGNHGLERNGDGEMSIGPSIPYLASYASTRKGGGGGGNDNERGCRKSRNQIHIQVEVKGLRGTTRKRARTVKERKGCSPRKEAQGRWRVSGCAKRVGSEKEAHGKLKRPGKWGAEGKEGL